MHVRHSAHAGIVELTGRNAGEVNATSAPAAIAYGGAGAQIPPCSGGAGAGDRPCKAGCEGGLTRLAASALPQSVRLLYASSCDLPFNDHLALRTRRI